MNIETFRQSIDKVIQEESGDDYEYDGSIDNQAEELPVDLAKLATAYEELAHESVSIERITDYILRLNTDDDIFTYQQARRRAHDDYSYATLDRHPRSLFFTIDDDNYDEECGIYDEIQYADLFLLTA